MPTPVDLAPIMPLCAAELLGWLDHGAMLVARSCADSPFIHGKRYTVQSARWSPRLPFHRSHQSVLLDGTLTREIHVCRLEFREWYAIVTDDSGIAHLFLAAPERCSGPRPGTALHSLAALWQFFVPPSVPSVAELAPERLARARAALLAMERR